MANLNDLTTEITNIKTDIFACYNELKDVLDTMNIPTDNCKMLDMIDKVGGLKRFADMLKVPEWLDLSYDNKWEKADLEPLGMKHTAYASAVVGTKIYIISGYTSDEDDEKTYHKTNYCYDTETGEWSTKKAIAAASAYHTAVAVGTKIYVMGGGSSTATSTATKTNYCYDTETDTWTTMTDMPARRMQHTAVAVGTKIYVMGGVANSVYYNTNYCYDTENNTWTTMKTISQVRSLHSAVAVGTKIYVMGGSSGFSVGTSTNTNYCYDTETDTWTTKQSFPSAFVSRRGHVAVAVGTKIYVMGGVDADDTHPLTKAYYDTETNAWSTLNDIPEGGIMSEDVNVVDSKIYIFYTPTYTGYIYHPTSDKFETMATMFLRNVYYHTAVAVGTKIYVMGGYRYEYSDRNNKNFCYDSKTNTWSTMSEMPGIRMAHSAVAVGTKIYVMGGTDGTTEYNTNYCYDTETDSWSTMTAIPAIISYHSAVAVGTKIYVMGGTDGSTNYNTNYCYDTETGEWITMTEMPESRLYHSAVAVGTKIYVMGGGSVSSDVAYSTNYCYDTETGEWSTMSDIPGRRFLHSAAAIGTKIYVMGGAHSTTYYSTNYCYDTETDSWSTMTAMTVKRMAHSAVAIGLNVYVFGKSFTNGSSEFYSCYIV